MPNRPIVSDREMAQIERNYGPKTAESAAYIERAGARVKQGIGYTRPAPTRTGPYGARVVYVGNMTVRERMEAGQLATAGDYIISLQAGVHVYTSDIILISALEWEPDKNYIRGKKASKVGDPTVIAEVSIPGVSGATEPTWPDRDGVTVIDNEITWVRIVTPRYQVIQITGPQTYGDLFSVRLAANMAQKVVQTPES